MALDIATLGDVAGDTTARVAALTAIDRTLLVEAGAGTGKTSVLAGRVVTLLAAGRPPASIAAISFTEFSAAELRERISLFVALVIEGKTPPDLLPAFPSGSASPEQVAHLRLAQAQLDLLSCMTIHSFCRMLLTPYPVEANIDPGATVLDRDESDLLFDETLRGWMRRRLSGTPDPNDVFQALFLADAAETRKLVEACARHLRKNRGSAPPECQALAGEFDVLRLAVERFRAFLNAECRAFCPEKITEIVLGLEEQVGRAPQGGTDAMLLPWALRLKVPKVCATDKDQFNAPSRACTKKMWAEAAGARVPKSTHERLHGIASELYTAIKTAHDALRSKAAGRALHLLADEAAGIVAEYDAVKRRRAAIDFEDLLEKTRVLLATHADVRRALATRYPAILVDEFQDTDPKQMEILWRLCGDPPDANEAAPWMDWVIRLGALFLVGDPKQSIYRFRGGDLPTYQKAAELLEATAPGATLRINRNFRSRMPLLDWVNGRFERVFTGADGQAAATSLVTDADDPLETVAVAHLAIDDQELLTGRPMRDIEAELVAKVCKKLIGNFQVRDRRGGLRPCEASDIALLTPVSTDLWRYERALEDEGLSVAAQAGKGFFRRQEIQDLIALTRVLADGRDRLALGALLRGPLVGIPDSVLLDTVEAQPPETGREPRLHLGMDLDRITDPIMRQAIERLVQLRKGRRSATPHALLGEAIEEFNVRPILKQRGGRVAERALANVDLFMEMARPYDLRGLKAFSDAMRGQWEDATRSGDARPDADRQSVNLITVHSAKGLEYPIVFLVNLSGWASMQNETPTDRLNGRFHMKVFGRSPEGCDDAVDAEKRHAKFQRERLCYVAGTRARDLLLLPDPRQRSDSRQWINVVDLGLEETQPFPWDHYVDAPPFGRSEAVNPQTEVVFGTEADRIVANRPHIERVTPSRNEDNAAADVAVESDGAPVSGAAELVAGAGWVRGNVLHKLLEEVLNGEIQDDAATLAARGGELIRQLNVPMGGAPDPKEMAEAVRRGLAHAEIAAIRHKLRPEWPLAMSSMRDDGVEEVVVGAADAVAVEDDGSVSCVVDWKSDVKPDDAAVARYRGQLGHYLMVTGAPRALLVFPSSGDVRVVTRADAGNT